MTVYTKILTPSLVGMELIKGQNHDTPSNTSAYSDANTHTQPHTIQRLNSRLNELAKIERASLDSLCNKPDLAEYISCATEELDTLDKTPLSIDRDVTQAEGDELIAKCESTFSAGPVKLRKCLSKNFLKMEARAKKTTQQANVKRLSEHDKRGIADTCRSLPHQNFETCVEELTAAMLATE